MSALQQRVCDSMTGRAAKDLGRKCVCIEREERYCEIGARRMQQECLQLTDCTAYRPTAEQGGLEI